MSDVVLTMCDSNKHKSHIRIERKITIVSKYNVTIYTRGGVVRTSVWPESFTRNQQWQTVIERKTRAFFF